jgi:hypothetical protein
VEGGRGLRVRGDRLLGLLDVGVAVGLADVGWAVGWAVVGVPVS